MVGGLGSLASWYLGDRGRRRRMVGDLGSLASWNLGDGGRRLFCGFWFLVVCLWDFVQMRWGSWVEVILCSGRRRRRRKMVFVSLALLQLQCSLCCMQVCVGEVPLVGLCVESCWHAYLSQFCYEHSLLIFSLVNCLHT